MYMGASSVSMVAYTSLNDRPIDAACLRLTEILSCEALGSAFSRTWYSVGFLAASATRVFPAASRS